MFFPNAFAMFARALTGDREKDAITIAKMVLQDVDAYRRIVAPEWPGTIDYTPEQMAQYIGRGGDDKAMQVQLSEFGAWRDQVMGVESRNGGTIRLLLDCIATCDRAKLAGHKDLEQLVAEQYAPDKHRHRWEGFGIARPYVWQDKPTRDAMANHMKVEFQILPRWLRGASSRGFDEAPKHSRDKPPERMGGYYEPEKEDVI